MNMNLAEEITQILRKTMREGTNRQQKDAYLQMLSYINRILENMSEEQDIFLKMFSIAAFEAGNSELGEQFQQMARKMNQEIEEMDKIKLIARGIVNQ